MPRSTLLVVLPLALPADFLPCDAEGRNAGTAPAGVIVGSKSVGGGLTTGGVKGASMASLVGGDEVELKGLKGSARDCAVGVEGEERASDRASAEDEVGAPKL